MAALDKKTYLIVERSRIRREKARLVLEKSISLYFIFMLVAVIGFVTEYINSETLNTMIILGIVILIAGTIPYVIFVHREEKNITKLLR